MPSPKKFRVDEDTAALRECRISEIYSLEEVKHLAVNQHISVTGKVISIDGVTPHSLAVTSVAAALQRVVTRPPHSLAVTSEAHATGLPERRQPFAYLEIEIYGKTYGAYIYIYIKYIYSASCKIP